MKVKARISLSSISPAWFNWSGIKNASEAIGSAVGILNFQGCHSADFTGTAPLC